MWTPATCTRHSKQPPRKRVVRSSSPRSSSPREALRSGSDSATRSRERIVDPRHSPVDPLAMKNAVPTSRPTFPWWIVLCLVGLDYFSSLAYLPSIAMNYVGALAPVAGLAVVLVTLLVAVPVYLYVV